MRALVTGSAGFVGRHLHAELERRGWQVDGLDVADPDGQDAVDFFRADRTRYDLAVHCAATIGGRAGIDGSPLSVATNLALDSWYFRWLQLSGTDRAVYFSSSAAYPVSLQDGTSAPVRLREQDLRLDLVHRADQTYGLAKLTGELLAEHAEQVGTRVVVVRPFSGYGGDQSLDYPFPSFVDRALRRADPFEVWGDGEQTRDWIHIDDVVAGTLAAVEAEVRGPVNVCTGRGTSFNELAGLVTSAAGYAPPIKHLNSMPAGVLHRVGDPTRLHTFYRPRISLEEGVQRALRWQ